MNIHEFQGKDMLRQYGVATPRGFPCNSADEAAEAATRLGGRAWTVKAQTHAPARAAGHGPRRAWSVAEVRRHADALLGTPLPAPGSAGVGRTVTRLLVEEGIDAAKTFYLGLSVDPASRRVVLVASSEGGVDIDALTAATPDKVRKVLIDPETGLKGGEAEALARGIGLSGKAVAPMCTLMQNLYRAFDASDASVAEINPLVLTRDGRFIALDARFNFDANALFRQPGIEAMRDPHEEDLSGAGLPAIAGIAPSPEGHIGCVVNGESLALTTMDLIRLHGGQSARCVDVRHDVTAASVAEAVLPMMRHPDLKAVLVHVFGGVLRCDAVAHGVIAAAREAGLAVPLIVRLQGTHDSAGRKLFAQSGLRASHANDMAHAVELAVAAARRSA
ncbi:MAG: succinate--CoA ligase subunit beta [Variovorax sp.]|nr:MAG: succinate--CoA ligase subunit beta [Variovorax sp.]